MDLVQTTLDGESVKIINITGSEKNTSIAYIDSSNNLKVKIKPVDWSLQQNLSTSATEMSNTKYDLTKPDYDSMVKITVKKNGTGDFTDIQTAINSISDASVNKQYDIQIYDDFYETDITKLVDWEVPTLYNTSTSSVDGQKSYIVTKDWVHIRGYNRKYTISFISPKNLPAASYQYINNIHPRGNCIIKNLNFEITGGRYAGHQESNGERTHMDYHATTVYDNCTFTHFGNSTSAGYPVGSWSAQCAMANGVNSGLTQIFESCEWKTAHTTAFYWHSNPNFDAPYKVSINNCKITCIGTRDRSAIACFQSDLGSGVYPEVTITNSDLISFTYGATSRDNESVIGGADDVRFGLPVLKGGNNAPMLVSNQTVQSLYINGTTNNQRVVVLSGTAKDLIWGETIKELSGSSNSTWRVIGAKRLANPTIGTSYVYSLPYRLGNCSETPKTLVISVGGVEKTILFNQNYMTSGGEPYTFETVPAISQAQIISAINSSASGYSVAVEALYDLPAVTDAYEIGFNNTTGWFTNRNLLCRDLAAGWNKWRLATSADRVEGFCAANIPGQSFGRILLAKKNVISGPWGITPTIGNYYKVASANTIVSGTGPADSSLYCIGTNIVIGI